MSHTYYIQDMREMPPRSGQKFNTTYLKATRDENELLFQYVKGIVDGITLDLQEAILYQEYDALEVYTSSLPGKHKHLNGDKYTMIEVVMDLYDQLKADKDPTESLVNRWNVAFNNVGVQDGVIDVKLGVRPKIGEVKL